MEETKTSKLNSFLKYIDKFFNSDLYLLTFGLFVFASWFFECEYIAVIFAILSMCYMFLTQASTNRLIVIAITIPAMVDLNMRNRISYSQLYILGPMLLLVVACAVYYFIKNYKSNGKNILTSSYFAGYVLVLVAGALGGLLYPEQTFLKTVIVVGAGLLLLGLYCLLYKTSGKEAKYTVIKSFILLSIIIVAQIITFYLRQPSFVKALTDKYMHLGWALTNSLAVMLAMAIPMCFYMAYKSKKGSIWYLLLAIVFYGTIFLTNCRSIILVGSVVYLACIVIGFFKLNKLDMLLSTLVLVAVGALAYAFLFEEIFNQFIRLGFDGNGREYLYEYYTKKFKENPVFGMGFYTDSYNYPTDNMVRAHNTLLQILVSTGIVGLVCFIPYFFQRYRAFTKKPNLFKVFALLSYLAFAGYGLVDCAMISSYKLIMVYMLMFAVELDSEEQSDIEKQLIAEGKLNPITLGHPLYRHFFKRFFDITLSLLGIIILSPIYLILAILVRTKLGSPIIFYQYRPGKNGKIFRFQKFRSMADLRDENGDLLPDSQRMTKFGKLLRKTSLDELPQLVNILKGEMSIVGPRPRMVEECVFLDSTQQDRFLVRPGITGWAQVNGRNNITLDVVVKYDKEYVEKMSLWFDIKILFKTVMCVLKRSDVNKQGTVSNEFHGDYLLRTGQIEEEYYKEKIKFAKALITEAKEKKAK